MAKFGRKHVLGISVAGVSIALLVVFSSFVLVAYHGQTQMVDGRTLQHRHVARL